MAGLKSSESPQRMHAGPVRTETSVQQASQIGAEERCGSGEPHRLQEEGKRAQLTASRGLRSTRATARHAEVSDGGTSNVSEPESLRKTHLAWTEEPLKNTHNPPLIYIYTRLSALIASHEDTEIDGRWSALKGSRAGHNACGADRSRFMFQRLCLPDCSDSERDCSCCKLRRRSNSCVVRRRSCFRFLRRSWLK